MSKVYSLKTVQTIPVSMDEAWAFFSHPKNLAEMTPEYLNLKFTNSLFRDEMYAGQVITYTVKPVFTSRKHLQQRQDEFLIN
jgi:ligand-binding SRPBCC domain-containing protein